MEVALLAVVLILSVILHEIAHGAAAWLNGDPTAREMGRLTLNPLAHVDVIGTLALPLFLLISSFFTHHLILFGWAKPVPYNPLRFRNRKIGTFWVGIAGPSANVVLALCFALVLRGYVLLGGGSLMWLAFLGAVVFVNILLGVFNLIPIPPLDGSRVVSVFLSPGLRGAYRSLESWGFLIIVVLVLYVDAFSALILGAAGFLFSVLAGFPLETLLYIIESSIR